MKNSISQKYILILIISLCFGCKINQYRNNQKVGKWIDKNRIDDIEYKNVQFYKKGFETGTWKSYVSGKITTKEKYKGDTCQITTYHPSGKVSSFGKSVIIRNSTENLHWFYIGKWSYFDKSGNLELIRIYTNGLETKEIIPVK